MVTHFPCSHVPSPEQPRGDAEGSQQFLMLIQMMGWAETCSDNVGRNPHVEEESAKESYVETEGRRDLCSGQNDNLGHCTTVRMCRSCLHGRRCEECEKRHETPSPARLTKQAASRAYF